MGRNANSPKSVSWAHYLLPQLEETAVFEAYKKDFRVDAPENAQAMRTPIQVYACPSRRQAAADRNFDNDDDPPLVLGAASLGDYAGNAGDEPDQGMEGNDFSTSGIDKTKAGPIFSGSQVLSAAHHRRPIEHAGGWRTAYSSHRLPTWIRIWNISKLATRRFWPAIRCKPSCAARRTAWPLARMTSRSDEDDGEIDYPDERFGSPHSGVVQFVYLDGHVDSLQTDIDKATLLGLSSIGGSEVLQR